MSGQVNKHFSSKENIHLSGYSTPVSLKLLGGLYFMVITTLHNYNASTIIAIPLPPPMQREAAPYFLLLRFE